MNIYLASDREAKALHDGTASAVMFPMVSRQRRFSAGDEVAIHEAWAPVIRVGDELFVQSGASSFIYRADGKQLPSLDQDGHLAFARWRAASQMQPGAVRTRMRAKTTIEARLHWLLKSDIGVDEILALGIRIPMNEAGKGLLRVTGKHPPSDYLGKVEHLANLTRADILNAELASAWDCDYSKVAPWATDPVVMFVRFEV